jgi:hypothetical protein
MRKLAFTLMLFLGLVAMSLVGNTEKAEASYYTHINTQEHVHWWVTLEFGLLPRRYDYRVTVAENIFIDQYGYKNSNNHIMQIYIPNYQRYMPAISIDADFDWNTYDEYYNGWSYKTRIFKSSFTGPGISVMYPSTDLVAFNRSNSQLIAQFWSNGRVTANTRLFNNHGQSSYDVTSMQF